MGLRKCLENWVGTFAILPPTGLTIPNPDLGRVITISLSGQSPSGPLMLNIHLEKRPSISEDIFNVRFSSSN